jgi:hypothetical protein
LGTAFASRGFAEIKLPLAFYDGGRFVFVNRHQCRTAAFATSIGWGELMMH